ncbi:MAG: Gfo/Idh/MocA family protein [Candidatus Heimdallarchaeaceae archaeon]
MIRNRTKMQNRKMNVAFIGTGNIAYQHMQALKEVDNVTVVGLYDINEEVLKTRQAQFGGKTYSSIDQMLDDSNPDAVYICLPPYAHGEAEFSCIERRIPFLVEKPLSNDFGLAKKIAEEVKKSGIITCSAYMNRYRKSINIAKKLLENYQVSLVNGGWLYETPVNHPWITKKDLSGGQLLEQTTHLFDMVRYLCGEITEVQCYGCKGVIPPSEAYDIEDATVVSLKLKSGAVASIQSSWSAGFDRFIYLNLLGPDIQIMFQNWEFDAQIKSRDNHEASVIDGEKNILAVESCAFSDAIRQNDPTKIKSDYVDGVESLQISFAAIKSLETGKPVHLDEWR